MKGKNLLEEPGILRVSYEAEERQQVHEWFDYNPEDRDPLILKLLDRIYELLIEYPVEKVLVKSENVRGAFSPQVTTFIRDVQFPRIAADTQVRFVATVNSTQFLQRIGTDVWRAQLDRQAALVTHCVESEAEARKWLQVVAKLAEQDE